MKKGIAVLIVGLILCGLLPGAFSEPISWNTNSCEYACIPAELNGPVEAHTGPGMNYDEVGSFLSAGKSVNVLSRFFDYESKLWWIHVEFLDHDKYYCVYTTEKNFVDLTLKGIPEEYEYGTCTLKKSATGYYGPGEEYAVIERKLPKEASCKVFGYVTGDHGEYVQIECYDKALKMNRRAWVPVSQVNDFEIVLTVF